MAERRQRLYSSEERAVIDVHKAEYLKTTSAKERQQLAQAKILPAIFNFWIKIKGIKIVDVTPRTKVCPVGIGIGI